ncbi:MAG: hypothetical protein LKJ76_01870 [Lachnospiraceae bacterium]|jgi:hypothetical protein|nr:hypothetical protein [Lachnospiraceae bacterium]
MQFYEKLYVSDKIKHPGVVKWKLRHRAGMADVYVITLPEGSSMPEFMHNAFLYQKYYRSAPLLIIGLAEGRDDATDLTVRIIKEAVDRSGNADVRAFLFPGGCAEEGTHGREEHK